MASYDSYVEFTGGNGKMEGMVGRRGFNIQKNSWYRMSRVEGVVNTVLLSQTYTPLFWRYWAMGPPLDVPLAVQVRNRRHHWPLRRQAPPPAKCERDWKMTLLDCTVLEQLSRCCKSPASGPLRLLDWSTQNSLRANDRQVRQGSLLCQSRASTVARSPLSKAWRSATTAPFRAHRQEGSNSQPSRQNKRRGAYHPRIRVTVT